ncbi:unnamed protein product, partial [Pocillopora meandrina]
MGWALKSKAKVMLGKKKSGEAVAKDMKKARDAKSERLFSLEEFLTPQQINSYFSRFAAKRRQLSESEI